MSLLFRPRREAVVRTPMDAAFIGERILALATGGPPTGFFGPVLPRSYFTNGWTSSDTFGLDYHCGTWKHPQAYRVRGQVVEGTVDSEVRLVCESRRTWVSGWVVAFLAVGAVTLVACVHPRFAITAGAFIAFLCGLHALSALVYTPSAIAGRVARAIAAQLDGAVSG